MGSRPKQMGVGRGKLLIIIRAEPLSTSDTLILRRNRKCFGLFIRTGAWSQVKMKNLRMCSSNPIQGQSCGTGLGTRTDKGETLQDLWEEVARLGRVLA